MEFIEKKQRRRLSPLPGVAIHEYDTADTSLSGATAEIKGRYPAQGFCVNRSVKELAYVIAGEGALLLRDRTVLIAEGDVLFLDREEAFAWEGDLVLFLATAPRFDPTQHQEIA